MADATVLPQPGDSALGAWEALAGVPAVVTCDGADVGPDSGLGSVGQGNTVECLPGDIGVGSFQLAAVTGGASVAAAGFGVSTDGAQATPRANALTTTLPGDAAFDAGCGSNLLSTTILARPGDAAPARGLPTLTGTAVIAASAGDSATDAGQGVAITAVIVAQAPGDAGTGGGSPTISGAAVVSGRPGDSSFDSHPAGLSLSVELAARSGDAAGDAGRGTNLVAATVVAIPGDAGAFAGRPSLAAAGLVAARAGDAAPGAAGLANGGSPSASATVLAAGFGANADAGQAAMGAVVTISARPGDASSGAGIPDAIARASSGCFIAVDGFYEPTTVIVGHFQCDGD